MHGFGGALWLSAYRESGAKVIANRALCAPTASKGLADFFVAQQGVHDPGPGLPGRLVPQVLRMAAGQRGDPVAVGVQMKSDDRRVTGSTPSVRVVFAFGRLLR